MSKYLAELLSMEGIKHPCVLAAIEQTDRKQFLPESIKELHKANRPLPIGHGQTSSQPYIVARMTELLLGDKDRLHKVLEIGTGSGYQGAILSKLADEVQTIEHIKPLYEQVRTRFKVLGYDNIVTHYGDGYLGWPNEAPYDGIIVTAAAPKIPQALKEQLAEGGRMVIPVGLAGGSQQLEVVEKQKNELNLTHDDLVIFVPLVPGVQ